MAFTGDQFVGITDKRILGYEDFGEYFLNHLRWAIEMVLSKVYTKNGTFGSTKIGLGSTSNDTFRLLADGEGVSSEGHLFEYSDSLTDYAFENQNAQTYQVGFHYSEYPIALAINPRTGKPEFTRYEEACGGEATAAGAPVVDNGSNLTIVVDGCVEAGVDNSGRQVRVWKNVPGDEADSMSVAVETATVQWGDLGSGNVNYVVTTAKFGQVTVDTSASSYSCQLIGPYVSRDSDIRTNGYWFIGEIDGNGPSATPIDFDLDSQNVIPYSLSETWDAANITADDANFHDEQMDDSDSGGIGTPYSLLQDVLDAIDESLVRGRTHITLSDGTQRTIADYVGATALTNVNSIGHGGTFMAKKGSSLALPADTASLGGAAHLPKIVGDVKTGGHDGFTPLIFQNGGTTNSKLRGTFERLSFYSGDFNNGWEVPLGVGYGDTRFHDCGFHAGNLQIIGNDSDEKAIVFNDCEFDAGSSAGAFESSLNAQRASTGYWPHVVFSRCVFRGPHSTASGAYGVVYIDDFGYAPDQVNTIKSRAFVFRDCRFIHEEINGMPTVWVGSNSPQEVIFENCIFKGKAGMTEPVFYGDASKIHFKNCVFDAPTGEAILLDGCDGTMVDCFVLSGNDTSTIAEPQLIAIESYTDYGFHIRNLKVDAGSASMRTTFGSGYPMIELGGVAGVEAGSSRVTLDGLYVKTHGSALLHRSGMLTLRSSDDLVSYYKNIVIDGDDSSYYLWSAPVIKIAGASPASSGEFLVVENLNLVNFPASSNNSSVNIIELQFAELRNSRVQMKGIASTVYAFDSVVEILDRSIIDTLVIETVGDSSYPPMQANEFMVYVGSADHSVVRNVDASRADCDLYCTGVVDVVGSQYCVIDGVKLPETTNWYQAMQAVHGNNSPDLIIRDVQGYVDPGTNLTDYLIWIEGSSAHASIAGCILRGPMGSYAFISLSQSYSIVIGNICDSTSGTTAGFTNTGTGAIGDSTLNVVA